MLKRLSLRYSLWLVLVIVVAGAPMLYAWHYRDLRPRPPVWPIPDNPTAARKAHMINLLLPIIRKQNDHIRAMRKRLETLYHHALSGLHLPSTDQVWLKSLAQTYQLSLPDKGFTPQWILQLLHHIDVVPADLALAQAASESAWGDSRFAKQANNYFGIWCFTEGCGLVPEQRPDGADYEVQYFSSAAKSVATYMLSLNSKDSYQTFRALRSELRQKHKPLTGKTLASGLENYSGIGNSYIAQLRKLIRHNDLSRFDYHNQSTSLATSPASHSDSADENQTASTHLPD